MKDKERKRREATGGFSLLFFQVLIVSFRRLFYFFATVYNHLCYRNPLEQLHKAMDVGLTGTRVHRLASQHI